MRCPLRFRGLILLAAPLLLAASPTACSRTDTVEAGAVGTTSSTDPVAVTFGSTYVTFENNMGLPIVEGQVEIVPRGVLPPFKASLPRIETSGRRDLSYAQFRSLDGTVYRPGITRTRHMRLVLTDVTGKTYEQTVEF